MPKKTSHYLRSRLEPGPLDPEVCALTTRKTQITTSYFSETYCGGNLTSMTGNITSPNHPDPYPKGIECVWHIKCPEGRGLLLLMPNASLPLTKDCSDHLIMRESASPFSKTTYYACESSANPVTFISRSKDLYIKFTSKSSNPMAEGFKIFYVTFEGKQFCFDTQQGSYTIREFYHSIFSCKA